MGDAKRAVHEAIGQMLGDGEIAVQWVLTIEVAGPDGARYLAHRYGGGLEGEDDPMMWTALGMLEASVSVAREQLLRRTFEAEDDDPDAG